MNRFLTYCKALPAEERANTLTHVFPLIGAFALIAPMIRLALATDNPTLSVIGTALFLIGMVLMFGSSTFYHLIVDPKHKARIRIMDHIAIYVMIAGSYSLLCLTVVGGWLGWTVFIFLWACVIAGIVGKLLALGKHPKLSLALYLAMGWVALVMIVPLWKNMSHAAFAWIFAEGLFYTVGAHFFRLDEERAFYHAIWHVFIILGAASHTIAMWLVLIP